MDATLEVRWFHEGTPPEAVQDWFAALGGDGKESVRTDWYLHTADPSLNVKLREGKAQTKRRLPGGGRMRLAEHVEGRAEPWRKFSFKTRDKHLLTDEERAAGLWMPVEKARLQHTIGPHTLADLLAEAESGGGANGRDVHGVEASVELTRIRMDDDPDNDPGGGADRSSGAPWWTICVETEGDPALLAAALAPAARHFFAGFPATLTPAASLGYMQWLLREWHPPALLPPGAEHPA